MKDRPELFKSTMIQKQGRIWLISDEGLNYIKKNTNTSGFFLVFYYPLKMYTNYFLSYFTPFYNYYYTLIISLN